LHNKIIIIIIIIIITATIMYVRREKDWTLYFILVFKEKGQVALLISRGRHQILLTSFCFLPFAWITIYSIHTQVYDAHTVATSISLFEN
jgi:hypothetical protein